MKKKTFNTVIFLRSVTHTHTHTHTDDPSV